MKQTPLYRFINPPIYTDPEEISTARILMTTLISSFLGITLLVIYRFTLGQQSLLVPLVAMIFAILVVMILTQRGYLSFSSPLFLWILLIFLDYLIIIGDGIHDTAVYALPGALIAGSLILKRWHFFLFVAITLLSVSAIGYLEIAGVVHNTYSARTNISDILDIVIIFAITTITLRLLADAQMGNLHHARESEEQFRAIVNGIPDALFIADENGNFIEANDAACKQVGYTKTELMKLNIRDIVLPKEASFARDRIISTGAGTDLFETNHVRKDGQIIPVEVSLVRMMSNGKRAVAGVARDITDRKTLEFRMLRAQRMESIGTLAGGIAHDLNNVLSPILLSIQGLKRRITDEHSKKTLQLIEETTKRGAELIKQVLSFARGMEGERIIVQLGHLLDETGKIIHETFPRSIRLHIDVQKNLPTLVGDATQLHQVLMNLCVNARDAMPNGGTLELKAETEILDQQFILANIEASVGMHIVVSVKDTGTGILPNVIERIFDPFFTTKETGKGTGLGLSTVHTIVKNHNGFVKVFSQVGAGTLFKVYLPAQEGKLDTLQNDEVELHVGKGELILVVDDEASIREITKSTLEVYGYTIVTASDGIEALAIFRSYRHAIALIITDMMMPNMGGAALISEVHAIDPTVKMLAISGLPQDELSKNQQHMYFLYKPFTSERLLLTIEEMLRK